MCEYSRSSCPGVFLRKGVLWICSKFKGEHPCQSASSINRSSPWVFSCCIFCCIFSEHIFLRTLLDGCFWYKLVSALFSRTMIKASERMHGRGVNFHVPKLNERQKIFIKSFMTFSKGTRNKTSYDVLLWRNQIMSGP